MLVLVGDFGQYLATVMAGETEGVMLEGWGRWNLGIGVDIPVFVVIRWALNGHNGWPE